MRPSRPASSRASSTRPSAPSSTSASSRTIPGCWVTGDPSGTTGRIAKYSGSDAAARFKSEVDAANNGLYFDTAVPGVGDEAFCTQLSIAGSVGVLARKGDTLVYASFLDPSILADPSFALGQNGLTSPTGCAASAKVAAALLH